MGRPGRVRSVRGSAGAASSRAKVSRPGRSPQAGAEGGPREGPRVPLSPPEGRVGSSGVSATRGPACPDTRGVREVSGYTRSSVRG